MARNEQQGLDEEFHDSSEQSDHHQNHNAIPPVSHPNFSRIEFPKLTNTQSVEYWFIRLESWFRLQNISDENVRFEAIVASLTPQLFDQVVDIIATPPEVEPYKKLKAALINKFTDSEYTRVDKLLSTVPLGAQRPSHLLAEIRRAGATRDEKILRVCWLRRLPVSIRTILSASKGTLVELAEMADATYDTVNAENISQVASYASSSSTFSSPQSTSAVSTQNELIKRIEALSLQVNELHQRQKHQPSRGREQQRSHGRKRSSSRASSQQRDQTPAANRQPTCWYHRYFGTQARKCESPCDFPAASPKAAKQ